MTKGDAQTIYTRIFLFVKINLNKTYTEKEGKKLVRNCYAKSIVVGNIAIKSRKGLTRVRDAKRLCTH